MLSGVLRTYGRCWVAMHIAIASGLCRSLATVCTSLRVAASSQQPAAPSKCPFSRLILGAGGEAPWACSAALVPPTHPPPPLSSSSPSLIITLSPSRSSDGLDQGGRSLPVFHSPHSHFERPLFFDTTFLRRVQHQRRYSVSFATCKISRAFRLSPSTLYPLDVHDDLLLVTHPIATRHRTAVASLVRTSYTASHLPILVSAQQPSVDSLLSPARLSPPADGISSFSIVSAKAHHPTRESKG
ncbi:hypothetical protein QBC39DRAFT_166160 [Podospora conica]|nr:hypothetical protein QBC39DRAFT_166160 [Schizothecium conicum]